MAQVKLNVVLHGLWGIEVNTSPDMIRIVTIDHHHHVIKAGKQGAPEHDLKNSRHQVYTLENATKGEKRDFSPEQNPTIKRDQPVHANRGQVKTVIDLPYPSDIKSVRTVDTANKGEFFGGTDGPPTPPKLAAVQVLVYDVEDYQKLKLFPSDWHPELTPDGTVNLHLYAEPDKDTIEHVKHDDEKATKSEDFHFVKAGRKLAEAFGLDITPLQIAKAADIPPVNPGVPGLTLLDTICLFEQAPSAAVSPAGCNFLVINNSEWG